MTSTNENWNLRRPVGQVQEFVLPVLGYSISHAVELRRPDVKWRDYYLLIWLAAGRAAAVLDDAELALAADDVVLLPPACVTGLRPGEGCRRYLLKLAGAAVPAVLDGLGLRPGRVYAAGPPPAALYERLHAALDDITPSGEIHAGACTYELLSEVAARRHRREHSPLIDQALHLIDQQWSDAILNVTALAGLLGVHRTLLAQRFKAQTGLSPGAYLRRYRVRRALELLQDEDLSIAAVGRRCGYPEPCQFARVVRRLTGRSPRELRAGG